MRWPPG